MAVKYELMVANGTYKKDGQDKTSWLRIGRIMSKQNGGFVMKLDAIPTSVIDRDGNNVGFDGWVQMFEPRDKQEQQASTPPENNSFDDSDIPFDNPYRMTWRSV